MEGLNSGGMIKMTEIELDTIEAKIKVTYAKAFGIKLKGNGHRMLPHSIIWNLDDIHQSDTELYQEFRVERWWCRKYV